VLHIWYYCVQDKKKICDMAFDIFDINDIPYEIISELKKEVALRPKPNTEYLDDEMKEKERNYVTEEVDGDLVKYRTGQWIDLPRQTVYLAPSPVGDLKENNSMGFNSFDVEFNSIMKCLYNEKGD
jgi:hypothetical protein